jgi:hypothetical protein
MIGGMIRAYEDGRRDAADKLPREGGWRGTYGERYRLGYNDECRRQKELAASAARMRACVVLEQMALQLD